MGKDFQSAVRKIRYLSVLRPNLYEMQEMISSVVELSPNLTAGRLLLVRCSTFFSQKTLALELLLLNNNGFVWNIMPCELDASLGRMRYSAAEVEFAGPSCSSRYNCHLVLSPIHQNLFMAAFHYLSQGLATYFTAAQPIVNLIFFFFS